jgi:hypothetical protein
MKGRYEFLTPGLRQLALIVKVELLLKSFDVFRLPGVRSMNFLTVVIIDAVGSSLVILIAKSGKAQNDRCNRVEHLIHSHRYDNMYDVDQGHILEPEFEQNIFLKSMQTEMGRILLKKYLKTKYKILFKKGI